MKIIVQNLAIEYQDEGNGRVMLLLHGWQDNLHTFDSLVSFFAPTYRVIRLDLPGFGGSETPRETWSLDNYVQLVQDFTKKLGVQIDVIVGHSLGGRIVMKGQATKKFQANKIVLIGSAGIAKRRTPRNVTLYVLAKVGGLVSYIPPLLFWREKLRKKLYDSIGSDYLNSGALKETYLNIITEDLSESAKKITVPTLLIWGADDTETPLSDGEQFSRLIRSSEFKVIQEAGHFVHKEKSDEVAKLMQEFL